MKTLIIVDVQNDFMPGGPLEIAGGDAVVPAVNAMIHTFDLVVATQDWHPPEHRSFASNHPGRNCFEIISLNGIEQVLWPDHCVQGTQGADFHPDLFMKPVEAIFRKGMDPEIDSYSGFFDNGRKKSTGLAGYLRDKNVREVFFCGLAGDICVYHTLRDAMEQGFTTGLILHATRPLNHEVFARQREELRAAGAIIL